MAITTDSYYDIVYDEETLDRIGLSKTLDNYSISEIADYAFVGSYSYYGRQISEKSLPNYTYIGYSELHGSCPFAATFNAQNYDQIFVDDGGTNNYNLTENGIYRAVVLMHRTNNDGYPYQLTEADFEYMQIITEMDAPKYTVNFGATEDMKFSNTPYWRPGDFTSKYNTHLGAVDNVEIATCGFTPYIVLQFQEHYFFINANTIWTGVGTDAPSFAATHINNSNISTCADQIYDYTVTYYAGISEAVNQWYQNYNFTNPIETPFIKTVNGDPEQYWCQYDGYASRIGFKYSAEDGFSQYFCFTTQDKLKLYIAGICGLHFIVDDTVYKPIIADNFVVGYSDDLEVESDLDNYVGSTKHDLPVTPPSPPPPPTPEGDDFDDHIMGAGSQLSGIATMWLLSRNQLIELHESFENAPANFDPLGSFISVMGLGISAFRVIGDSLPWTLNPIKIRMSNGELWTTGAEGHIVDKQVSAFNETGIRIQRKYNNFLDYSPYATHEIFLPMCGWVTLPDIAVDRPITVTYIPDIESLKCRAVVSVVDNSGYRCVVGEKEGVMGAEIPFTNTGHSLWVANLVVNSMDVAGEMVTGAIGAGFTKTNAQGGKYRPYEGFTIGMAGTLPGAVGNALLSGNINRTHYTTGNGSRIGFGDGENIQIKSTYHRIDKPENYDHTVGKVCNKTGKLSEFSGFTVCDNPHINFSALEAEKEEIKRLLEEGVIL